MSFIYSYLLLDDRNIYEFPKNDFFSILGNILIVHGFRQTVGNCTFAALMFFLISNHCPPKDYTPSSSVPPMVQETAHATATPTMMPTTKPTSSTSKSPAPLAGLVIGLGAAALLIRMRK